MKGEALCRGSRLMGRTGKSPSLLSAQHHGHRRHTYPPFKLVLQQAYNHRADVVAKYHKVSAREATPRMASHEETFETLFSERDTGILCHVFKLAAYLDSAGAP